MAREEVHIGQEIKIIPLWAWIVAPLIFVGMQLFMHLWIPTQHNPPPLAVRIVAGLLAGIALGFYILLIGYVNRDAGRRGMSRTLWTLLVIFIPNGIGFIIYFLLRQPLLQHCPQCQTTIEAGFNFCPKCHFNLNPTCPHCSKPVRAGDMYCPYCGQELDAKAALRT